MPAPHAETIAHWRAAENRLYPVVMTRPDLYERSLTLVRAVADDLRSAETLDDLVAAYNHAPDLVAGTLQRRDLSANELDMGLVTGAAFSIRYRELLEEINRQEARRLILEGREQGAGWIVLHQTDNPLAPYRRLEMHLKSGAGLHAFIEPDPDTGGPLFGVELVQLDPQTGDWLSDVPALAERQTFSGRQQWEQAARQLRARYEGGE